MARFSRLPAGTKYALWMNVGMGCDHTIACGESLDPLKSTNLADATREAEAICRDRDHDCRSQDGDGPVHDVVEAAVIAIQSVHVLDLPAFFAALDGERKIEEQRRREHAERKEYERLKQKFG